MAVFSREEQRRWLARVDELKVSIRSLIEEARSGGHDPVPEAISDMLDELKAELLEEFQTSRWNTAGRSVRAFPPGFRPVAMFAERLFRRLADSLESQAAATRIRLRESRP